MTIVVADQMHRNTHVRTPTHTRAHAYARTYAHTHTHERTETKRHKHEDTQIHNHSDTHITIGNVNLLAPIFQLYCTAYIDWTGCVCILGSVLLGNTQVEN